MGSLLRMTIIICNVNLSSSYNICWWKYRVIYCLQGHHIFSFIWNSCSFSSLHKRWLRVHFDSSSISLFAKLPREYNEPLYPFYLENICVVTIVSFFVIRVVFIFTVPDQISWEVRNLNLYPRYGYKNQIIPVHLWFA